MEHMMAPKRDAHWIGSIHASPTGTDRSYTKDCEWTTMRKECQVQKMEHSYDLYIERLIVTNVALFLFIMELLLAINLISIVILTQHIKWEYGTLLTLMILLPLILLICFKRKSSFQHFRLFNIIASCAAALLVLLMDMLGRNYVKGRYDHIIIVSVYFLLPIAFYGKPYLLGIGVSLIYLLCPMLTNAINLRPFELSKHVCNAFYLISLNVVMMAFRICMEYHLRQLILTRRQLLHQSFVLKETKEKEKNIVATIVPADIAHSLDHEIQKRIADQLLCKRILPIKLYSDVSILAAEMVNYAQLTSQMDVKDLVQIFHELFVEFDLAAEDHKVLRIKFLGDSFSCVSGIPQHCYTHANSCVELALDMILKARHLCEVHDLLDIKMRIGVHSGEVFAGIIGRSKWEYDIWSRDVDIANRLEFTGMPGRVHISQTTLKLLHNEYDYEPSSRLDSSDIYLKKTYYINTYLISPKLSKSTIKGAKRIFNMTPGSRTAHSVFEKELDASHEYQLKIYHLMYKKVKCMPIGAIQMARIFDFSDGSRDGNEDRVFQSYITSFWRHFRQADIEWKYINKPDLLMKYSLPLMVFVGLLFIIEHMLSPTYSYVLIMWVVLVVLLLLCLLVFYKKIVFQLSTNPLEYKPQFILDRWLFKISELCEENLAMRIGIYFFGLFLVYILASFNTVACLIHGIQMNNIDGVKLLMPAEATDNVIMVFTLMFFTDLPFVLKMALIILVCISHIVIVQSSHIKSEFQIIWFIIAFCLMLLIMEQHNTYLKKVGYYYNMRYVETQRQTEIIRRSQRVLMVNILPNHVARLFLEHPQVEELFHESYNKVAVMSASIVNFERDKCGLRVLNEYICYIDDLLLDYRGDFQVEKIKVKNWTYMAACGLKVDHSMELPSCKQQNEPRLSHPTLQNDDNCVLTLLHFAVDLLRMMHDIALQNMHLKFGGSMRGQMKIGIAHGPIVAGVVGLSPPHYDIWGHTVNSASGMCSSGIAGFIQVTKETAQTLHGFDIKCSYRGMMNVASVGEVSSYLVDLDERLNLQHIDKEDLDIIEFVDAYSKSDKVVKHNF
ncbi:adenylate cyclase type 7 isoform X2 [Drosophila grimshawi]|uniref:adenylate cyclase type 7 isoform X2 n=1 Tax=Drosophila grimshawi TaxID=7222 RepID=UPI000C86FC35|nr:adenylate cyclase type 7 isoform X2 [Drosophila grimshawi]